MKKLFFTFILINLLFSLHAEFRYLAVSENTTIKEDKTEAKAAVCFNSTLLQVNTNFEIKPEQKIKTYGIKYQVIPQINFYYGHLSFSGLYGRIKTPCFSIPGALSSASVPSTGISVSLPSSGTSSSTPKAVSLKANIGNINLTYLIRHRTAETEYDEYFAGIDYHPAKTRLHFSLFGGSFETESEYNSRWFLAKRPYKKEKIHYTGFEAVYKGSYLKVHSLNNISSSPYDKITGSWRFSTTITNRFFRFDSGFFWCDADHITIEEAFLRKTFVSYLHPQLKSVTLKNGHKIRSGITFSVARSYSDGMDPDCTKRADLALAAEYRTNLLTFVMNIKCENALHGADNSTKEEIAENRKTKESKSLYKFMDYSSRNAFLCYTEKTANVLGLGFKASPKLAGRTQQLNMNADFKVFPLNREKNEINTSASFTYNPADRFSFSLKQSVEFSFDDEITADMNVYRLNSIKTELKGKMNFACKNSSSSLTAKVSLKKDLDSPDKPVILFYCGATFYIKP